MEISRAPRSFPLQAPAAPASAARAGEKFEAMLIAKLLATTRTPGPGLAGDTPLAAGSAQRHEQIDRLRAETLAAAAPLGLAKLIEGSK